jgi:hypothetical protein
MNLSRKLNTHGFTHLIALIAIVTIALIGGVFAMVLKSRDDHPVQSNLATSTSASASSKNTLSTNANSQSKLSTTASTSQPNSSPATSSSLSATTPSKASPSTSAKSTSPTSGPTTSSPAAAPAPVQTPLSVLTTLITNLDSGAQVNVTAAAVNVPGPISTAQARPIVFTANGQVYFAYHQGSPANYTATPSQSASSMAIVNATVSNPSLVQAHLDKSANLVDPNISGYLVGYSTGGN